jgi:hypothetical protein
MDDLLQKRESWITEAYVLDHINDLRIIRSSQLFWWVAYLRLSKDYWWCCQQKGNCLDVDLRRVYENFGNLFSYTSLDDWWNIYGLRLFGLPETDKKIQCSSNLNNTIDKNIGMILTIPFGLQHEDINKQIRYLLDKNSYFEKCSSKTAMYQLEDYPTKARRRLLTAYQTWCLQELVSDVRIKDKMSSWGQYEIGSSLNLAPRQQPHPKDTITTAKAKQKAVRATTKQNYDDANRLIANVEIGKFPCKSKVLARLRWTPQQLKLRDEAIADGLWQSAGWISKEYSFLDPHQSRFFKADRTSDPKESIALLLAYKNMHLPFMCSHKQARAAQAKARLSIRIPNHF